MSENAFPDKKYNIIYADPPKLYNKFVSPSKKIWGMANRHYDLMTDEEIINLPVQEISARDSLLFLWASFPNLPFFIDLVGKWGFEYKTAAFVWSKYSKTNNVVKKDGMGSYTLSNCEIVLLGRKGRFNRVSKKVRQYLETIDENPLPEIHKHHIIGHSKKPNIFRNRIVDLCGDLPRIELFARTPIHGWDTWGNDEKLNLQPLEKFT